MKIQSILTAALGALLTTSVLHAADYAVASDGTAGRSVNAAIGGGRLLNKWSFCAWVFITEGGSYAAPDSPVALLTSQESPPSGVSAEILLTDNGGTQRLEIGRSNYYYGIQSTGAVPLHQWVHVAVTVSSTNFVSYYINIGQVSSRYRRAVSPRLAVERLMLLDAVLDVGDVEWLTTAAEKAAYLERLKAEATVEARQQPSGEEAPRAALPLSSVVPIGVASDWRTLLLFLASEPTTEVFRSFLQTHAALLRVAPTWTIRIVFPRPLDHAYDAYQTVIHEELESPLHSATIGELKWYFEHRLKVARGEPMHPQTQTFLTKGHEVFGTPRFTAMYQRWLKHGNAVFEGPSSPAIAEALNTGRGRVESVVLRHAYRHLSPLVADTPARSEPVDEGLRRGPRGGPQRSRAVNPRPQPPREEPALSISEQLEREWRERMEIYKAQKAQAVTP